MICFILLYVLDYHLVEGFSLTPVLTWWPEDDWCSLLTHLGQKTNRWRTSKLCSGAFSIGLCKPNSIKIVNWKHMQSNFAAEVKSPLQETSGGLPDNVKLYMCGNSPEQIV